MPRHRQTSKPICPACRGLPESRSLDVAAKYHRLVKRLDAHLDSGALIPDPDGDRDPSLTPCSYAEMKAMDGLPDIFSFFFRCTGCAKRFNLMCETYHGGGGHWKVVTPGSRER